MRATARAGAVAAMILAMLADGARAQTVDKNQPKTGVVDRGVARPDVQPPKSIRVTLSVYSGRPNPTWTLESGPDFDRLVALLKDLKPSAARLFDYDEWNRLGYASFWVSARDLPGVPGELHVWRDMAVVPSKDGNGMQATGAAKLYDALVGEAEANGYNRFFQNYRKTTPGKPKPR
jgi:hypothetical protein